MSDVREMVTTDELVAIEDRLQALEQKLDKVVLFCERALKTAELLSKHPMMASIFPGGIKKD